MTTADHATQLYRAAFADDTDGPSASPCAPQTAEQVEQDPQAGSDNPEPQNGPQTDAVMIGASRRTVEPDDTHPRDLTEHPEEAARRAFRQLVRLVDGLQARNITSLAGAEVDTVLAELDKQQRKAAMLPTVLLWRDHTAAVLDTLVEEVDDQPVTTQGLKDAQRRAREVLAVDPERAYGFAGPLPHDAVTERLREADREIAHLREHGRTRARVVVELSRQRDEARADNARLMADRDQALADARDLRHLVDELRIQRDQLRGELTSMEQQRDDLRALKQGEHGEWQRLVADRAQLRAVANAARTYLGAVHAGIAWTERAALYDAIDALNDTKPCICNPTHRIDDKICQHQPATHEETP